MKASEVLRRARDLAIQERFQVDAPWIILAVVDSGLALHALHVECGCAIQTWFELTTRTPQDIRALFDRAIAAAEARGE